MHSTTHVHSYRVPHTIKCRALDYETGAPDSVQRRKPRLRGPSPPSHTPLSTLALGYGMFLLDKLTSIQKQYAALCVVQPLIDLHQRHHNPSAIFSIDSKANPPAWILPSSPSLCTAPCENVRTIMMPNAQKAQHVARIPVTTNRKLCKFLLRFCGGG
jgi:hypothetical protein